jgi:hypothetical protein
MWSRLIKVDVQLGEHDRVKKDARQRCELLLASSYIPEVFKGDYLVVMYEASSLAVFRTASLCVRSIEWDACTPGPISAARMLFPPRKAALPSEPY